MARTERPYWVHSDPGAAPVPPRRPASAGPCKGPCNARWRKAQEALDTYARAVDAWENNPIGAPPAEPDVPVASAWPGDPVFCARCQAIIRRELSELDDLASIRARHADGHRKHPGGERVSGTRGAPSPSPAADDTDEMASMLRGWESVARGMDSTPPRRGYLAGEITTVVCWLVAHFDQLIANPDIAGDFAREIRQWHQRLTAAEKAGTGRHHKPMPCPRCGERSLEWEEGTTYVACTNRDWGRRECGKLLSLDEYDAEFAAWLGTQQQPAAEQHGSAA